MNKIKIISVGKTKELWLEEALKEYIKRLQPWASLEFLWAKNDEQLLILLQKEQIYVCLDPLGQTFTSPGFTSFLQKKLEEDGARLTFVIGGPEGLPKEIRQNAALLSLSSLTFTHQMTRLILVEQIYRAFSIANGLPYHK